MAQAPASTKKTTKTSAKTAIKSVAIPEPVVVKAAPKVAAPKKAKKIANKPFAQGTGRRKSAVARVLLRKGNGQILVNGRPLDQYFTVMPAFNASKLSFETFSMTTGMLADVKVSGGGYAAQADAVQLSIARALLQFDENLKP